ncbi:MAG TPA: hypothetical protein VIW64_17030 [Pyrinomonadaceae bacterium]
MRKEIRELKADQALARLCVVSLIQLVGVSLTFFLIKYGPRAFGLTVEADWQRDCMVIAYVLGATIILLFLTFILSYLRRLRPGFPEGIILVTFGVNIIAFSLAMARTGGPSHSFFTQLIPMQLSGILILEQQKAIMISEQSSGRTRAWLYAGFTVFVWLIVVLFPGQVASLFGRQEMTIETSLKTYEEWAATVLFILGMIVTAFAYWVTPRPEFVASFRRDD